MKRTGYLHDNRYLLHDTGPYHPETADRLTAIFDGIQAAGLLDQLILLPAVRADLKWIQTVHAQSYIRRFEEVCLSGNRTFDYPDNQMCVDTYETAFLAVGGVIDVARRIMEDELDNAFCAIRPPGHHAESNQAMGFCYFNNVAIATRYLQQTHGVERIGIIDFDVHHGNGTQQIFEEDPSVFYYSIHQHPSFAFPGTGREFEEGEGPGQGFTKNSPVLPGQGDGTYKKLIESDMLPVIDRFNPQFIIVSCGFDGHEDDDMSDISLSTEGYSWIMETIMKMGDQYAAGRVLSVLEGGYCLERLGELAANHVRILLDA
ncbi:histone deacetylase [Desulfosarcina ovata]|uniref:Histone deacetylase n=2 Tax=Desulfosarcina ovata TaxID=83564 RepID=A0A5K8AJ05_9BACT|nr:histone deacetylase [Desulfosarcina ovata]BBO85523.1 histone deacetylase [Desulfosarcina ovata subsp. sediminis]BBO92558.1 histone deacetylase [Desulfosarcina ovata subsp. ovata]